MLLPSLSLPLSHFRCLGLGVNAMHKRLLSDHLCCFRCAVHGDFVQFGFLRLTCAYTMLFRCRCPNRFMTSGSGIRLTCLRPPRRQQRQLVLHCLFVGTGVGFRASDLSYDVGRSGAPTRRSLWCASITGCRSGTQRQSTTSTPWPLGHASTKFVDGTVIS